MKVTDEELGLLAEIIKEKISEEFRGKHMSGNLAKEVSVSKDGDGNVAVSIPARQYNMKQFQMTGNIVHYGGKSYASRLDEEGSSFPIYDGKGRFLFTANPRNHIGFAEDVIDASVDEWLTRLNGKYKIKGRG